MNPTLSAFPPIQTTQPRSIVFGVGALQLCTEYLQKQNFQRVLLLKSNSAASLQTVLPQWHQIIPDLLIHSGIPPEPDVASYYNVIRNIGPQPLDAVIAVGGGSVLDVAKLIAALHGNPAPISGFFGNNLIPKRKTALICLPTTAGTGSEVSPNAILYDAESGAKRAVISPELVPDATFTDPSLTLSLPPHITAATGFDALSHCIEAFANRRAHPFIDHYALEGIRLISANIVRAVQDGSDIEARTAVALGSLYGGLCLGPVNTAAVHALSYPLGSRFRLPHGLVNALLLPHVMRFNTPSAPQRYATIATAMGINSANTPDELAESGIRHIEKTCRLCNLPHGIGPLGIQSGDIPGLAAEALQVKRLLDNNLRAVTQADAELIYKNAF